MKNQTDQAADTGSEKEFDQDGADFHGRCQQPLGPGRPSPRVSEQRVAMRVSLGGHDVLAKKLKERFPRILSNLKAALQELSNVWVFDNNDLRTPYRLVSIVQDGRIIKLSDRSTVARISSAENLANTMWLSRRWWAREDSNFRPLPCQGRKLHDLQPPTLKTKDLFDSKALRKCYGATEVLRNATDR
jgi:hypothetical protein